MALQLQNSKERNMIDLTKHQDNMAIQKLNLN